MNDFKDDIEKALETLFSGGIILYPTDTVWGLGCDATKPDAVAKVRKIKQAEDDKSMLIILNNINRIYSYSDAVPEVALDLIEIADKPTTVIFSEAKNLAENLPAADGSIGIRVVNEAFCNKLLQKFKKPIVSTSANITGKKTPSYYRQISEEVKQKVDYIVRYRQEEITGAQASSIIKIAADSSIKIIRK